MSNGAETTNGNDKTNEAMATVGKTMTTGAMMTNGANSDKVNMMLQDVQPGVHTQSIPSCQASSNDIIAK